MSNNNEEWLEMLLHRWACLAPEVRAQLQLYMNLPPRDHKNRRQLEKKLKIEANRSQTFHYDTPRHKAHC